MDYAFSHNVQQLSVTCSFEKQSQFPLSLFNSPSLKHLTLTTDGYGFGYIIRTSTWDLPALTTLHLSHVTFCEDEFGECNDLFSKCVNLKNLTLDHFDMRGSDVLIIHHPRLSNLTFKSSRYPEKVINVVAHQLENLNIIDCFAKFSISAPDLSSLLCKCYGLPQLSTDGFHSLSNVNLCIRPSRLDHPYKVVCLLQEVHSAKFLTLSLEIIELLSLYSDLFLHHPSPFNNLKNLKIYPSHLDEKYSTNEEHSNKVTMSPEVRNYLLANSPTATFIMVSREEARARKDAQQTKKWMAELQTLLERKKADIEAKRADIRQTKAPFSAHLRRSIHIRWYWRQLERRISQGRAETGYILSEKNWAYIEESWAKLLPTHWSPEMQRQFDRLCAEADSVTMTIIDCNALQCAHIHTCFRELASSSGAEARARKNAQEAKKCIGGLQMWLEKKQVVSEAMSELQLLLEEKKADIEAAKRVNIEQGKAPMTSHKRRIEEKKAEMADQFRRKEQIEGYWAKLQRWIVERRAETECILSKMSHIEQLWAKLPSTHRSPEMQRQFDRLCADADSVAMNIIDCNVM